MTKNIPKAADEVAVMQHLSQQSAAWLVGLDARVLRDQVIPRDSDGRYDARDVVRFLKGRLAIPEFNEDFEERILVLVDSFHDGLSGPGLRFLESIEAEFGDAGLAEVMRRWMEHNRSSEPYEPTPDLTPAQVQAEVQKAVEARIASNRDHNARYRMEVAVICDYCHKLRRGKRWLKSKPPEGWHVSYGICPDCK